ncbi:amidohydrolase family protein [Altibacter lentus]|uniref:amidohydrolase family protein n=1 Tax=Altibacter lentus TaxID=1223410 RepID=UPI000553EC06|nr:amidohydrolase family protein [Altibacter lentus]
MKKHTLTLIALLVVLSVKAQIIDVHLHSYTDTDYWGGRTHPTGIDSPKNAEEHLARTIALMDKHQIEYAVVSGSMESVEKYVLADARFIPGYMDSEELLPIDTFEQLIKEGKIKVFGEVAGVYFGRTLNDPIYAPYLKICEQYGIPVAYHTGGGPPMTPYGCCPNFRIALGDPYLIEDVLVTYPKLQVYLMHGGEVYFEHAVRMLSMYRHLYVDLGVLLWVDPMLNDYAVRLLKLAQKAKTLDRIMFGTDQMVWPESISTSIEFINSLDFLSEKEKRMILYENARTFLKLPK